MNEKNLEKNEWFIKNYNKDKKYKNYHIPSDEELNKIYNEKFENLSVSDLKNYIQKILDSYEIQKHYIFLY